MHKFVKGTLIFVGGVINGIVVGGLMVTRFALKSENIREGVKRAISDKISALLYGEERPKRRSSFVSYKDFYANNKKEDKPEVPELIFETLEAAKAVRDAMADCVEKYGLATVADLYDLAEIPAVYTDNRYGWTNLCGSKINRVRSGYKLSLPDPMSLKF